MILYGGGVAGKGLFSKLQYFVLDVSAVSRSFLAFACRSTLPTEHSTFVSLFKFSKQICYWTVTLYRFKCFALLPYLLWRDVLKPVISSYGQWSGQWSSTGSFAHSLKKSYRRPSPFSSCPTLRHLVHFCVALYYLPFPLQHRVVGVGCDTAWYDAAYIEVWGVFWCDVNWLSCGVGAWVVWCRTTEGGRVC